MEYMREKESERVHAGNVIIKKNGNACTDKKRQS